MTRRRPLQSFDIQRLYQLLPHRYPFLMVDRIINIDGDNSAVGIKNVTVNEPHFAGHFPGPADHARRAPHRRHGADRRRDLRRSAQCAPSRQRSIS